MVVMVLSKIGNALSHSIIGSSLAGDGLLVRIRSTSIALFGLVTAIGLGLVVFISQQGWPGVFSGSIPANPPAVGAVHDAVALTPSIRIGAVSRAAAVARRTASGPAHGVGRGSHSSEGSGIHRAHQVGSTPNVPPSATGTPQPPVPVSESAGEPVVTSPAPTSTSTGSPAPSSANQPKDSSPSQSKSTASSPDTAKGQGSSGKDKAYSHRGSKGASTGKTKGYSAPPSKSNHSSPGKSAEGHGAPASPAPEPSSKEAPAEGGYSGGKDRGYSGHGNEKSGKGDH